MTLFPFDAFIRLVEFDQQMKQLRLHINNDEKSIEQLRLQKAMLSQDLEHLKKSVHDMQKIVDSQELDMKALDDRAAFLKQNIETATNAKEYNSFKKELETIRTQQHHLEDTLVAAWHQLEGSQRSLQQKSETIAQTLAKMDNDISEKEMHLRDQKNRLQEQLAHRTERLHEIPAEWLEKYEGMYMRVDDPAVPVIDGACSGCFYPVSVQDIARLKRRALLQCNSCYRFLYDPTMLQSDAVQS